MNILILLLIYSAFTSLGLPDGILGAAWPEMRVGFGVALNANWPMLTLGVAGGILSSFFSGLILRHLGVGKVLVITTFMTAGVILGYAFSPWFALITALAFFLGLGNGAVDTGLNHFVINNLSSRHMNWLHAFWGVGISLGSLIISGIFAANGSWRTAYLIIGVIQFALGVAFVLNIKSIQQHHHGAKTAAKTEHPPFLSTFRIPAAWASMMLFFTYCGVEFGTGVWITSLLHDGRSWSMESAGLMVTIYWSSLTVGRFLIGTISNRLPTVRLVRYAILGTIAGTSLISVSSLLPGHVEVAGIVTAIGLIATGLSLAPIFPMLMHDTPRCVGKAHSLNLVGFQSGFANLGLTILPSTMGTVMRYTSTAYLGPMLLFFAITMLALLSLREHLHRKARSSAPQTDIAQSVR